MIHGCEGNERCPVYVGSRFGVTPQKYPRIFIIILLYIPGMN